MGEAIPQQPSHRKGVYTRPLPGELIGKAPHCTLQTEGLLLWGMEKVMEYQGRALWAWIRFCL